MQLFKASNPKDKVAGEAIFSFINAMGVFEQTGINILKECGIEDPKAGKWYPMQPWLDAFKMISERVGNATLKIIGREVPGVAIWPDEIQTIEQAFETIDKAYYMNHKSGDIGHYKFKKTGERSAEMICTNPYPDAFDLGLITAVGEKMIGKGYLSKVKIDESKPTRSKGGDSTTYVITW